MAVLMHVFDTLLIETIEAKVRMLLFALIDAYIDNLTANTGAQVGR